MAITFQYNKTSLNALDRQLKIRERALPTIKSKESALRAEVKRAKNEAERLQIKLQDQMQAYDYVHALWNEFDPALIAVKDIEINTTKIAGVPIPVLGNLIFEEKQFRLYSEPFWVPQGIKILKELAKTGIESEFYYEKMRLLDHARRKTTQKVNLYEKVQIPGYQEAIRKIKRFMEDEDNLSKASQKIVKKRQQEDEQ